MATPALQAANPLRLPHFRTAEVTIVSLLWLILSVWGGSTCRHGRGGSSSHY